MFTFARVRGYRKSFARKLWRFTLFALLILENPYKVNIYCKTQQGNLEVMYFLVYNRKLLRWVAVAPFTSAVVEPLRKIGDGKEHCLCGDGFLNCGV